MTDNTETDNTEIDNTETETEKSETQYEAKNTETENDDMPKFQITLPEGAVLLQERPDKFEQEWIILHEDYVVAEEYPYEPYNPRMEAGWVTLWDGEYRQAGKTVPSIPEEFYTAECWCIVFEDPNGMNGTLETGIHSNWIFLNKKCFTKEEALEIAETFVPVFTE